MGRAIINPCLYTVLILLSAVPIDAQPEPDEATPDEATPAAPTFETSSTEAPTVLPTPPGTSVEIHDALVARRPGEPVAAAYVCCQGDGEFTVCRGQSGGNPLLWRCVDEHEKEHLAWFAEHLPDACMGQPRGSCRFDMTPRQFRELECDGYRAELRCLNRHRARVSGPEIGELLWRRYLLLREAQNRFGCDTTDW